MTSCLPCLRGLHNACRGDCTCSHSLNTVTVITNEGTEEKEETSEEPKASRKSGRGYARDAFLKDQQSTGRKRAAVLYPLDRSLLCEWANRGNVGGGITIDGCGLRDGTTANLQQCRHHGPDYNTLNNDPENVHRICHSCHNSWHAVNDPTKDEAYLKLYGAAGGTSFKNSKVLKREES